MKRYLIIDEVTEEVYSWDLYRKDVINAATEYYHRHFCKDNDYDPKFKVRFLRKAFEFWKCNGYCVYLRR